MVHIGREFDSRKEGEPRPTLFVLGASGLTGRSFANAARREDIEVIVPSHQEFDIAEMRVSRMLSFLQRYRPSVVVNFAAKTNVDECEKERGNKEGKVWQTNVSGPQRLALSCLALDIPLVHISTDYVLAGLKENCPHKEDEPAAPVDGFYCQTKAEAEQRVTAPGGKVHIVRIQLPFTHEQDMKLDFPRLVVQRLSRGETFAVVTDQLITPGYAEDYAHAILRIADSEDYGIWHVASPTVVTPFEFAQMVVNSVEKYGLSFDHSLIKEITFDEFSATRPAPRPQYNAFDIPNGRYVGSFGLRDLRSLPIMLLDWAGKFVPQFRTNNAKF
ncbi:sugar nucleotide-binding protein [Candidatus Microgenomates bacterium]|nr:sugar nucleotide-binding protein [Candidatus Microgenomates bacterium]